MPDVCTMAAIVTQTLTACFSPPACRMSEDGTKKLCVESAPVNCADLQPRTYECVREDGTRYRWPELK